MRLKFKVPTPVTQRLSRPRLSSVSRAVIDQRLTYLTPHKLLILERALGAIEKEQVRGDVLECGIALGGSTIVLSTLCSDRRFHGYDVFDMIPPPTQADPPEVHER